MEQQVVIPPKKSSVSESASLILGTDLGFSLQAKLATRNSPSTPLVVEKLRFSDRIQ